MTKARDLANIISGGFTASDIPNLDTSKITTGTLANARVADLPTSKITSGTFADARISEASVTQHVTATDLQPLKSDLTALALREATNEASAAFNLPHSFIETFTDDTNLGTQTDCDRVTGYVATVYTGDATHQAITAGDTGGGNIGGAALTDMASAITLAQNGVSTAGFMYTNSSSVSGYFMADLGAAYTVMQMDIGKYRGNGDFRSIKMTSGTGSASSTSTTDINFTGASSTVVHGTSKNLSNFSSTGTADWEGLNGAGQGTVCRVTGFTPFSMRWIRFKAGSADFHDANAHWAELKLYVQASENNATGTLIQSANAVTGTRTTVGGTFMYKDNSGTASIGTDLKIYFTANGGSNWTEAAGYTAITPVYSTGIKQVRLTETTVTGGTDVRYKAVWANQSDGSKETQLHGIGINY